MRDSYFDLVREFPLVAIKTEKHHDSAVAFLHRLAVRNEASLDTGEQLYLEALTQFVEDYESRHHRIAVEHLKPLPALKYLMAENAMRTADLGRLLGSASVASQILRGTRGLSKRHMLLLAERFRVDAGLFLEADQSRSR